jgi:Lon protease-like protein
MPMSDDLSPPVDFGGTARLFPLPNVVLFPQVMLPLHIFEPRYREMTEEALAGDRLIAMVLLKPGWEEEHEVRPPLHSIVCLGRIVADQRLEDGRFNILLRGLARGRIVEELEQDKLYRSARVELLENTSVPGPEKAQELRDELARFVTRWFQALGVASEQLEKLLESELPVEALGDILGFALPLKVAFKQELLEELDAEKRLYRLVDYLKTNDPPTAENPSPRKFPPEFSPN